MFIPSHFYLITDNLQQWRKLKESLLIELQNYQKKNGKKPSSSVGTNSLKVNANLMRVSILFFFPLSYINSFILKRSFRVAWTCQAYGTERRDSRENCLQFPEPWNKVLFDENCIITYLFYLLEGFHGRTFCILQFPSFWKGFYF